jgi:Putative MetA-pathway of phenol degradation
MKKWILSVAISTSAGITAHAQLSAYLPDRGQVVVTPTYAYSFYDEAWIGKHKMPIDQDQHSIFLTVEYGILDWLAVDATMGYSWAHIDGAGSDDGLTDTTIGLRARLLDEDGGAPFQLALRVGAIIPGSYDTGFPFAIGDGAGGIEESLLVAKRLTDWLTFYGDFGHRWRAEDVPQDLFASGGLSATFGHVTVSCGYRGVWGLDGGDIGGPGFGKSYGFPQTKEIQHNIEASIGFTDPDDRFYQVFYSRTLDGRNTGEHNVFGISVSIPFGGAHEEVYSPPVGKNPVRSSK